ncbi:MAG: helix-turn-helix domain-containing protein [Dietzia psychralcaliphila]
MKIAVHVFDGITMFHLAAPLLVFGEVTRLGLANGWTVNTWSAHGLGVRTAEGLLLEDLCGPDVAAEADLLVFPSWPVDLRDPVPELLDVIHGAHRRGAAVAGLCLGAFPVVASGVLDGRSAVTHWEGAEELGRRAPGVEVRSADLYIDHGDVLTSAGTASSLDACLHLVRRHLGSAEAATLARHIVVAPHREGDQAQYIQQPIPQRSGDDRVGEAIEWALSNLDQRLSVDDLAARACMSRRNFVRSFHKVTGTSPARWVLSRRLDHARVLLEKTSHPVGTIAQECGFGSVVTFRQNFVRTFSTTPTSYRGRFGDSGPS